jgi:hypothetical protein
MFSDDRQEQSLLQTIDSLSLRNAILLLSIAYFSYSYIKSLVAYRVRISNSIVIILPNNTL